MGCKIYGVGLSGCGSMQKRTLRKAAFTDFSELFGMYSMCVSQSRGEKDNGENCLSFTVTHRVIQSLTLDPTTICDSYTKD